MTDRAAPELFLDLWKHIASFSDNEDLDRLKGVSKLLNHASLDAAYHRLYMMDQNMMDQTLPPVLPQEGALVVYKEAFKKIQARQLEEIEYLRFCRVSTREEPKYISAFEKNTPLSLKDLEARNAILDEINSHIITAIIQKTINTNPNKTTLNLYCEQITRVPVTIFQEEDYAYFWQNLTELTCTENAQLTTLNLYGLPALQTLNCQNNQRLTILTLQDLPALQELSIDTKLLATLNLAGVPEEIKRRFTGFEKKSMLSAEKKAHPIATPAQENTYKNVLDHSTVLLAGLSIASDIFYQVASAYYYLPSFSSEPEEVKVCKREDNEDVENENKGCSINPYFM